MDSNNKDTRWIPATICGIIGILGLPTIIIPIFCLILIADLYE